jgi:hypothetical protein
LDTGGADDHLVERLEGAVRAVLADRGGRAFGACRSCRYFRKDQRSNPLPHHCALLDEPLSAEDAGLICVEQSA